MKHLLVLAMLVLLSGCEVTTFEKAPLPDLACDKQLVGHWLSVAENGKTEADGEIELRIGSDCSLELDEQKHGLIKRGEPTQLHVGQSGRFHYVWVDAGWAQVRFELDKAVHEQDVIVLSYRVNKKLLELQSTDDKAIAHQIIDGRIAGDVSRSNDRLLNRITGGPHPQVLEMSGVFERKKLRFRRANASEAP